MCIKKYLSTILKTLKHSETPIQQTRIILSKAGVASMCVFIKSASPAFIEMPSLTHCVLLPLLQMLLLHFIHLFSKATTYFLDHTYLYLYLYLYFYLYLHFAHLHLGWRGISGMRLVSPARCSRVANTIFLTWTSVSYCIVFVFVLYKRICICICIVIVLHFPHMDIGFVGMFRDKSAISISASRSPLNILPPILD